MKQNEIEKFKNQIKKRFARRFSPQDLGNVFIEVDGEELTDFIFEITLKAWDKGYKYGKREEHDALSPTQ